MHPQLLADPSHLPPRPPVTYSHHSTSTLTPHGLGAAVNHVDDEARGEAAFDRISRNARGTHGGGARYRMAARAATKAANRPCTAGAQSKPGALTRSIVRPRKGKEKSDASHRPELCSSTNEEDDSDIAEAKIMSLLSNEEPTKHAVEYRSYKSIGSGSASISTAPHTALYSLLDDMHNTAKAVEEASPQNLATAGLELAGIMEEWHNTMTRVIHATEAAELKRIQDVQAQLDYDRVVEDKYKREMDTFSRQAGAQMLQMQQDYHLVSREQKQPYRNLLAKQVVQPTAPTAQDRQPSAEPAQSRTVKSPSPHLQDKVDRLTNENTSLKSENETKVCNTQASHADQVLILQRKVERLENANVLVRIQEKSNEKMREMEAMKHMFEAQLQEMKEEAEKSAKQNAKLKQQIPPIPPFLFTAGSEQGFSRSTRSYPGPFLKRGATVGRAKGLGADDG